MVVPQALNVELRIIAIEVWEGCGSGGHNRGHMEVKVG